MMRKSHRLYIIICCRFVCLVFFYLKFVTSKIQCLFKWSVLKRFVFDPLSKGINTTGTYFTYPSRSPLAACEKQDPVQTSSYNFQGTTWSCAILHTWTCCYQGSRSFTKIKRCSPTSSSICKHCYLWTTRFHMRRSWTLESTSTTYPECFITC